NQPPQISLSTNRVTTVAGLMTTNIVVATVSDVDTNFDPNAVLNLHLTARSSDRSIVAPEGVFFSNLTAGADKRSVTVVPAGAATGTATLTILVDDGPNGITNSATLDVTVLPLNPILYQIAANSNAFNIPANSSTSSTITIPNNTYSGLIGKLSVSVVGLKSF